VRDAKLWGGQKPTATPVQIDDLVLWITLGIILGGRIGYVLFYMLMNADQRAGLAENPLTVFKIWEGGMSFHGGFLGVCAAIALFARQHKIDMLKLGDLVAPVAPIGLFFGRCANFINGELWGRVTDHPFGMIFCNRHDPAPRTAALPRRADLPRHPSQLYEAALEGVLLFLILNFAAHKLKWLQRRGALVATFLIFYGLFRASLENVRNPDHGMPDFPLGLTMGMILSIPMLLVGAWLLWRALREPVPLPSRKIMSLLDRLRAQIAQDGPISVAEYFTRCLHDPRDGYYATRPALGEGGDFLTAPGVSQMFGELIGLWILETWTRMGRPAPVRLVEMGPGDGTLISDILRAARLLPEFLEAADLWLVEVSPPLRAARPPGWPTRPDAELGRPPGGRAGRRAADPGRQRGAGLPAGPPVRADRGRLGRADGRAG
jgi:phosphatidylglycerol:prolipoprotein diacylglycerol transferase